MPKIRTCKHTVAGTEFTSDLRVDSKGVFTLTAPGLEGDRPNDLSISGPQAEEVETRWKAAVRDYAQRSKTERKVIAVKFDSSLRLNGSKSTFDREHMLLLECMVCLETTLKRGEKVEITYTEHPDCSGMHKSQPFPWHFKANTARLNFDRSNIIFVDWTQEIEDALVTACKGIQAVVDMLDQVLATPEALTLSISSLNTLRLTAPSS